MKSAASWPHFPGEAHSVLCDPSAQFAAAVKNAIRNANERWAVTELSLAAIPG
jgi:hypothetical protein